MVRLFVSSLHEIYQGGYADNDFDEGDDVAAAAEIRDEIEQRIHQLEHMVSVMV